VIAAPPFETGAVQETNEPVFRFDEASTEVGAPGIVDGTAEATAATDVPLAFVAVTLNV